MVFQTAPPHPASKARLTWSPQLLGGPDASQNGLGDLMPAQRVVKSAMDLLQAAGDSRAGAFAIGHSVDHLAAAVDAIAPGKITRITGLACGGVHGHGASSELD